MTGRIDDRGSVTVELAIVAPALLLLLAGLVFAGRLQTASAAVEQASRTAARDASLARDAAAARTAATAAADRELSGTQCVATSTAIDVSGFDSRLGTAAAVTATISCTVSIADLAAPGLPGTRTITATATSPLDRYRQR